MIPLTSAQVQLFLSFDLRLAQDIDYVLSPKEVITNNEFFLIALLMQLRNGVNEIDEMREICSPFFTDEEFDHVISLLSNNGLIEMDDHLIQLSSITPPFLNGSSYPDEMETPPSIDPKLLSLVATSDQTITAETTNSTPVNAINKISELHSAFFSPTPKAIKRPTPDSDSEDNITVDTPRIPE